YYALNHNRPVLDSKVISSTGGVRDPHILRGPDGTTFYMVLTDMVSALGWDSNRAMVLLKSSDLINWDHTVINIQQRYAGQEDLKRVWAPQTIYDPEADKLMIYWSMQHGDGPDIIYYAYANDDFTDLEGEPQPLFIPRDSMSCIDGDIVYKDGVYHLFYKTEGHGNGIKAATSTSLTSGQWAEEPDYKQQTTDAVEGAGTFKIIGTDKYILMYDVYMAGRYQFTESTDLSKFRAIDTEVTMDFHPRHGTIIPITDAELKRLYDKWGMPEALSENAHNPIIAGFHADPDIIYSNQTEKYYIYTSTEGTRKRNNTTFRAYSSPDLKKWKDEGVVLDILSDEIDWADGQAWAPAVLERKQADGYHYYMFFSANNPETSRKEIG
ncbi:MAG: family 43 glycosylhydrolase, partial [Muribaculaceae bacterium]|nr:family 43 glycosylhydrolase [Muribaculaceae bacterium]